MEDVISVRKLTFSAFLTCCFSAGLPIHSLANNPNSDGINYLFDDKTELNRPDVITPPPVILPADAEPTETNLYEGAPETPVLINTPNIEFPVPSNNAAQNMPSEPVNPEEAVDLLADEVQYDENNFLVSAIGNVELVQAGRILRADKITYDLSKDNVKADGNVVLNEISGDTFFADNVVLEQKMKDGFVKGLKGVLADGSRFSAENAQKVADLKVIMNKATYTACEPCKADPDRDPIWQIKARNVTHHRDEARISYDDATFEVAGVPVAYAPYFSHPDGSIKRKSGFLTPRIGFDSQLGTNYGQQYYLDIAPDKDATFGLTAFTDEAPLATVEYRQRFKDAEIKVNTGATYSSRIDSVNEEDVEVDAEERGHLFVEGLWNINEKWRAGTELQLVSDDQYLRQYDFSNEDVIENRAYVERFSGRDYATARIINFKDIRISERREDQPNVLPEVYAKFIGAPNETLGGRWDVETSLLGLQREGNDQDVNRATLKAGWEKRHISNVGLVSKVNLTARGDAYNVNDRNIASTTNQRSTDSSSVRGFTQAQVQTSYPIGKDFEKTQLVIEPIVSMAAGTNLDSDDQDIPNEDSQDVSIDASNLFSANRFPGYDRIEDGSFGTYGVRTGLYGDNGYKGEFFVGQSYRFDDDDENPFPDGSGLSEKESDFVGNVSIAAGPNLNLNYGLLLDNEGLSSQRHELDASGRVGRLSLNTRYFYANALQGTDLDDSREQILVGGRFMLTDEWSAIGTTQYDLAKETEGLRYARYGLDYQGQCVNFQVTGQRTLTRDSSGDSGTEIMLRIGLKNLGEFETGGFSIGGSDSNDDDDIEEDLEGMNE